MSVSVLKKLFAMAAMVFASSASLHADLIVYEGFDYTAGTNIPGQSGGTGFAGDWVGLLAGGAGTANVDAGAGFTFGTLAVNGGSLERNDRNGRGVVHRAVAPNPALTADGNTVWFSVLMDPTINTTATGGQFGNSYATLTFGNENLTDSSIGTDNGSGTDIGNSGDAFGVGFYGGPTGFADGGIQAVTFDGGVITQTDGGANSVVTGDVLSLVVGSIEYGVGGANDTLTLYNVAATDTALPTAFATVTADLDNASFDTISIADGQTSGFDEIRFGTSLEKVTPGLFTAVPEPSSMMILMGLGGLGLLRRRK